MSPRLADRLSAARRQQFVGRSGELSLFASALAAPDLPFQLLHVFGPGGIGKTTLLCEFGRVCDQTGVPAVYVDGRNVEPSPQAFVAALRSTLGLESEQSPVEALAARAGRHVLLIDTYEALLPLDGWLRETLLPQLPEQTLIVLAGHQPPSPAWRLDPGWQTLIHVLPLRNLGPDEGRAYLDRRSVPTEQHDAILAFTHGHPLALSLAADLLAQRPDVRFQPEEAPDLVRMLLEQLVQKVPGPAHRAALEACALVRLTTEGLLAELLGISDVHELFDWLRDLSFVEAGRQGLFPHDLAREALVADLRWRNPDWYAELHSRARAYYTARVRQAGPQEQQRVLVDYTFLHRDNLVVRSFFEALWSGAESEAAHGTGTVLPDAVQDTDRRALVEMVRRHEGDASAATAARWMERLPQATVVFRNSAPEPLGFALMLPVEQLSPEDVESDPGTQAAVAYLQRRAPLRPGERATMFRFWMARDSYQAVSPTQGLIFVSMVRHYLVTPGLAFTFLPCAQPDLWAPMFAYADLARLPEADFEVGGRTYGMYGHDWRAVPPMDWLGLLADREVAAATAEPSRARSPEPLVVLGETEFAAAVRDVLRDFGQTDALLASPLLRSRLVTERTGATAALSDRVVALQNVVREAAESLRASSRQARSYRAVLCTYLHPAPTQQQAAAALDLPFSTYRRHLKEGVARLIRVLWQRELQGAAK